jgi:protein dithiol oxidoreductase (disulfide-forming)
VREDILRKLIGGFLGLLIGATSGPALAQTDKYVEGRDYEVVSFSHPLGQANLERIEVDYFFMAHCRLCFAMEADYQAWLKRQPPDVEVVRVQESGLISGEPVFVGGKWDSERPAVESRGWYTAVALNVADELFPAMYEALQRSLPLETEAEWIEFFSAHGFSAEEATRIFNSEAAQNAAIEAESRLDADVAFRARGLFTAKTLNIAERLFPALDRAINGSWGILTEEHWIEFFSAHGISAETASQVFNSEGVAERRRQADRLWRRYDILYAPDFVVGGRYKPTSSFTNQGRGQLELIDFLIGKVRKERNGDR